MSTFSLTLFYRGELKANGNASKKHDLRLALSPQIQRALEAQPHVLRSRNDGADVITPRFDHAGMKCGDWHFLAFANTDPGGGGLDYEPLPHVELDIIMMRPSPVGHVVRGGGDIDNRLKTLFDALQTPDPNQAASLSPAPSPTRVFCLLHDDKQISRINVRTAQLLDVNDDSRDVVLIIDALICGGTVV